MKVSEIYIWPCVEYFSSLVELRKKLDDYTTDKNHNGMSKCIKQANKRRRFESESNLCSALQEIERYSESRSFTASTLTYEESMKDLYS